MRSCICFLEACVKGRGVASPHARRDEEMPGAPHIDIDYCFPRSKVTIFGVKDSISGATASLWVPKKGGSIAWISEHLRNIIDYEWGRSKIIFKSDGEEAILDLKRIVHAMITKQTIFEKSPTGESQSNGRAENMIREIEGMIRTWKIHLEE